MSGDRHHGRRVLISGATSGIGLACARRFVAEGARVWLLGSRADTVRAALEDLDRASGGSACDVADEGAVDAALVEAGDALGAVDVAFVNAGIDGEGRNVTDLDAQHFRRVLEVNVLGAFLIARGAARLMPGGGSIVVNSSVNALRPEPLFADYNASKAAALSLAQTMALDLADREIAVTAICAGYVRTRMTEPYIADRDTAERLLGEIPAHRFANADEIAALVSFLASAEARYMTGAVVPIDGARHV